MEVVEQALSLVRLTSVLPKMPRLVRSFPNVIPSILTHGKSSSVTRFLHTPSKTSFGLSLYSLPTTLSYQPIDRKHIQYNRYLSVSNTKRIRIAWKAIKAITSSSGKTHQANDVMAPCKSLIFSPDGISNVERFPSYPWH